VANIVVPEMDWTALAKSSFQEALKPQRIARRRARTRFDPLRRSTLPVRRSRRVSRDFLNTCTSEQAVSLDGGQEEATRQKKPKAPKAKAANADKEKAPVKDEPRTPAAAALRVPK
jgi:hypothetical protein